MRNPVHDLRRRSTLLVLALIIGLLSGCKSVKTAEEQLSETDLEKDPPKQTLFLTGTKPGDKVTDPNKLGFEITRIESDDYPKQIRAYARVFDSTGNFITNLAPPAHGSQEYWKKLTETVKIERPE